MDLSCVFPSDFAKVVVWGSRRTIMITITITRICTATPRKVVGITVMPCTRRKQAARITMHTRVGTRTRTMDRQV